MTLTGGDDAWQRRLKMAPPQAEILPQNQLIDN